MRPLYVPGAFSCPGDHCASGWILLHPRCWLGGVPMKNVCEETSAVAGAEPKSQLEPRHNGGRSGGGGGANFGCGGIVKTGVTWTR